MEQYSIVCENNAGQYYPMYAYNHPLFTKDSEKDWVGILQEVNVLIKCGCFWDKRNKYR